MIDIVLLGAQGKMGQMVQTSLSSLPWARFVLGLNQPQDMIDFESNQTCLLNHTVVIDFSAPDATLDFLKTTTLPWPMVIGTTGFSEQQLKEIQQYATTRPILKAANFSLGVAAMQRALEVLLQVLPANAFDLHLYETHHTQKKDAPSGTALLMKQWIEKSPFNRFLPICVDRRGDNKGQHRITLFNQDETITLMHQANQRTAFSSGALLAAQWLVDQPPGYYDLNDYLDAIKPQK